MKELDKMLNQELYNSNDLELVKLRNKTKDLCIKYNHLLSHEKDKKIKILEELFNTKLENITIEPNFYCDYGFNIKLGKNFYANYNLVILDANKVTIGDNCFIGPNVGIYTSTHPINYNIRNKNLESSHPITIGNNVWIGGNSTILDGVTIGDNVVIGAGSVITHNIKSNTIVYGNPAKEMKEIDTHEHTNIKSI